MLALNAGNRAEAERMLRTALDGFQALGVRFQVAQTKQALAELVDEGERAQLLSEALDAYEDLGARPFADRIRSDVRSQVESGS